MRLQKRSHPVEVAARNVADGFDAVFAGDIVQRFVRKQNRYAVFSGAGAGDGFIVAPKVFFKNRRETLYQPVLVRTAHSSPGTTTFDALYFIKRNNNPAGPEC